ncbi:LysR family transcriptional regulator [Sporolactobacillus laevolacticus]|uniref:LysR family transcriptional regulator n=1 Tax=Sporolactobacillus laevolacticus TaxID=33018 RepID=UPI0025B48D69|nr:LysR family transcriptional regulator [Sporolactobacillus laevolacticus]MDN3955126.1 LysR family transcriptional regulator [Sporolactobacillus laevolacticus]
MTFRHLRIFITVCDLLNMTAAADALFMSQPAVSQAISDLEKYYGVRLFERLSRKLYLTHAGEKLLSYARQMIRMSRDSEIEIRTLNETGTVRIGASVTVGAYVLPKLVSGFQKSNAQVKAEVIEDNTAQIEKLILRDQLDLALVEGETVSSDLIQRPFTEDELVLICGRQHRFAQLPEVEPHDLEKEPFIIRERGSGTRKTFEDVMTGASLSWKAIWTCNNADSIKMAVSEGLGISVISERAVKNEVHSGLLCVKKINGLRFKRQFKIIYHKNKYLTQSMQKFIDLCFK